jgi:hypothetical protein
MIKCFFWKACLSIKQPVTAHDPIHPVGAKPAATMLKCALGNSVLGTTLTQAVDPPALLARAASA